MARKWKEFTRSTGFRDTQTPRVTIQKDGNLGINRAAMALIDTPERIVYLRDEGSTSFGIAAAPEGAMNAYPARPQANGSSYVASAKLFLQWAGVPLRDQPQYFIPKLEGDVLVVNFGDPAGDKKKEPTTRKNNDPDVAEGRGRREPSWR